MIQKGAVHEVPNSHPRDGFASTLFLVPKRGGGQSQRVKSILRTPTFQNGGYSHAAGSSQRKRPSGKDWFKRRILYPIPIWKNHQKYLQFLWKDTLLEFTCLPFGLASAPLVLTKILRPVIALLRKHGVQLIISLDDILIMAESVEIAKAHANLAVNLLTRLEWQKSSIKMPQYSYRDKNFLGWGACCEDLNKGGHWSQTKDLLHINCLKLIAGGFALKSFVKDRCHIKVLLLMDNRTSVAYLNKVGTHPHAFSLPWPIKYGSGVSTEV